MAYFPFFTDIKNKKCLIVGGGPVACRKAEALMDYEPDIIVISPAISKRMVKNCEASTGRMTLLYRECSDEDISGCDFVVAATADRLLNRHISQICSRLRIPVNVVDAREECSFLFPSIIKDHNITIGISTGGDSPAITRYLKEQFQAIIPEGFGALAAQLGSYRELVKGRVEKASVRKEIFKEMLSESLLCGCAYSREQAERLIERKLEEQGDAYE